jgi:hypothetical protein
MGLGRDNMIIKKGQAYQSKQMGQCMCGHQYKNHYFVLDKDSKIYKVLELHEAQGDAGSGHHGTDEALERIYSKNLFEQMVRKDLILTGEFTTNKEKKKGSVKNGKPTKRSGFQRSNKGR